MSLARLLESRGGSGGRDPRGGRERGAEEGGSAEHYGGVAGPIGDSGGIRDRSKALQWLVDNELAGVLKLWGCSCWVGRFRSGRSAPSGRCPNEET